MSIGQISKSVNPVKKTYFGLAAFLTAVISCLFLGAHFGVAYLDISPHTFAQLNTITTLVFCILTPLAFALGAWGITRKDDSMQLSVIAIVLVTIPFLILLAQFIDAMMQNASMVQ